MKLIKILACIANILLICVGIRVFAYEQVPGVVIFVIAGANILAFSSFKFNYTALHFEKKAKEEKKRIETLKKIVGGKTPSKKRKHINLSKPKFKPEKKPLDDYMRLRGK